MAIFYGTFGGRTNHRLELHIVPGAGNVAGNYTPVSWGLYAVRASGTGSYSLSPNGDASVNIGGHTWSRGGWTYDFRSSSSLTLGGGTFNIGHDAAGYGGFTASGWANSGSTLGAASASGYVGLAHIPKRASAPGTPVLTPGPGTMGVSWALPASNGGASVSSYTIQYAENDAMTGALTKSATGLATSLTGLTFGKWHYVRVAANNSVGTSDYSAISSAFVGIGGRRFDGTAEVPFSSAMRWDGLAEVPITVAVRWDGTREVPLV